MKIFHFLHFCNFYQKFKYKIVTFPGRKRELKRQKREKEEEKTEKEPVFQKITKLSLFFFFGKLVLKKLA